MKATRLAALSGSMVLALALAGCFGTPQSAPSPNATASSAAPSTTAPASPAPSSSTPAPTTQAPSPTGGQLPEQTAPLAVFYIAVGDGGVSGPAVGCGDSAVATSTEPVTFRDQVGPAMTRLLTNRSRDVGQSGLINVLYQSTLAYQGASFDGTTITVYLTGQFFLGGVCDIPRAEAQITFTAMAAAGAQRAEVFVNGRPMAEMLSLKG